MKFNTKTMGRMLAAVVFACGLMLVSAGCGEKKGCAGCDKQAAAKCAGDCSKDCSKGCAKATAVAKKCPAGCTKPCCKKS